MSSTEGDEVPPSLFLTVSDIQGGGDASQGLKTGLLNISGPLTFDQMKRSVDAGKRSSSQLSSVLAELTITSGTRSAGTLLPQEPDHGETHERAII